MKKAFCLMNHALTEKQAEELRLGFCVADIVYPDSELSKSWGQIPATAELDMEIIGRVISWLASAERGDTFIVQGEPGSSFMVVDYALKNGIIPLHAVTRRVSVETKIGEQVQKQAVFEHVCFRKYRYFND